MNSHVKEVRYGTRQEVSISPKAGYELEKVEVVNKVDNSIVPCELTKTSDNPAEYVCSFIQPAGNVAIQPFVRPIVYSVMFEVCEECDILFVEEGSQADVEIKSAIGYEDDEHPEVSEDAETDEDFKQPQHSTNENDEPGASAGEEDDKPVNDVDNSGGEAAPEDEDAEGADSGNEQSATEFDVCYEDDEEDEEPIVISAAEFDKRNNLYWKWREKYERGECPDEKFKEIKKRHFEFTDKISEGKIIVQ